MREFAAYFSDESIIRQLCKARIKLAKHRHDDQFFHNISRDLEQKTPRLAQSSGVEDIFPPRRAWHRFRGRPEKRKGRSTHNLNVESLLRATLVLRNNTTEAWADNLAKLVRRIQLRVLFERAFEFAPPWIRPSEKKRGRHEYRALVEFQFEDKTIDCLVAKYLRETLDHVLRDSSLAFRCRKGHNATPTIHSALQKIVNINRRHRKSGLFVAECDIKGFYDCVSHTLVQRSLSELIKEAQLANPSLSIDKRALNIVDGYLRSYSFSRDVHPQESEANKLLRSRDAKGSYKWPLSDLRRLHRGKTFPQIGVPQGSAISCFVANAVLHFADKEMDSVRRALKRQFTYMRYCDDMILLAQDRRVCQIAFNRYCKAVRSLLLPIHEPAPVQGYLTPRLKKDFWKSKSNRPYHWSRPKGRSVPWIQFLGYQVRHDGLVRIRRASLKKEFAKIRAAADLMLRILDPSHKSAITRNKYEILHRFRMKLISMAVGRRQLGPPIHGPLPMCWTNGFKGLVDHKFVSGSLKALDRHRESQIERIARRLDSLNLALLKKKNYRPPVQKYYGYPFSYWAQFRKR